MRRAAALTPSVVGTTAGSSGQTVGFKTAQQVYVAARPAGLDIPAGRLAVSGEWRCGAASGGSLTHQARAAAFRPLRAARAGLPLARSLEMV